MSCDGRRRQLDRQAKEIESLRAALTTQPQSMKQTRAEKENIKSDTSDLRPLASKLEFELKRIQQEANQFGRDLVRLRTERDQLLVHHRDEIEQHERTTKQIRAQLRDLKQQLAKRKEQPNTAVEMYVES